MSEERLYFVSPNDSPAYSQYRLTSEDRVFIANTPCETPYCRGIMTYTLVKPNDAGNYELKGDDGSKVEISLEDLKAVSTKPKGNTVATSESSTTTNEPESPSEGGDGSEG